MVAEVAFDSDLSVYRVQRVELDLSEESKWLFAADTQPPSNFFLCLREKKVIHPSIHLQKLLVSGHGGLLEPLPPA